MKEMTWGLRLVWENEECALKSYLKIGMSVIRVQRTILESRTTMTPVLQVMKKSAHRSWPLDVSRTPTRARELCCTTTHFISPTTQCISTNRSYLDYGKPFNNRINALSTTWKMSFDKRGWEANSANGSFVANLITLLFSVIHIQRSYYLREGKAFARKKNDDQIILPPASQCEHQIHHTFSTCWTQTAEACIQRSTFLLWKCTNRPHFECSVPKILDIGLNWADKRSFGLPMRTVHLQLAILLSWEDWRYSTI